MRELLSSIKSSFTNLKKPLTVETTALFDSESETFIVGYSHQKNRIRNVGTGDTLGQAFIDLSESIKSSTRHQKRETLKEGDETGLEIEVYHIKSKSTYVVSVSDGQNVVEGTGSSMSKAFADVGNKISVKNAS